jgi:hypothetical protein
MDIMVVKIIKNEISKPGPKFGLDRGNCANPDYS